MTMNLTKLGKMMTHLRAKFLKNGKNRTTIFEKGKNYGSVFYIKDYKFNSYFPASLIFKMDCQFTLKKQMCGKNLGSPRDRQLLKVSCC